ncbi:hypothetical protein C9374_010644 [Naegleria lovaniensis]|uniref:Uncharacterized protein n=1 Tax=Naegleria lovaniensis TaxID=51637 RepID=A0AA88GBF7_NAELO|nr:uncharacterized protein C9374_010644 [Naegleria lovaniensis]KAG2374625.1 hypothetical protein C9374_010644 [Naegleria lovaniensis]
MLRNKINYKLSNNNRLGISSSNDDFEHVHHTTLRDSGFREYDDDNEEIIETSMADHSQFHQPVSHSSGSRNNHHVRLIEEEPQEYLPSPTTTSKLKEKPNDPSTHPVLQSLNIKQFEKIALRNIGMKHEEEDPRHDTWIARKKSGKDLDQSAASDEDEEFASSHHHKRLLEATTTNHHPIDSEDEDHSTLSVGSVSTTHTNTYTDVDSVIDPIHPHIKHKHYYPIRHKATREEKIAYSKKVGRTLFSIFLVIFMTSLTIIDVIVSPKNTWVTRLSIFVSMVILWRFLYEYLFEIIFEWILEYLIKDE